ncbi:hypothetical protein B0H10DRAFT_2010932, partial [Mycena sp. CBHHK59/15]
MSSPSFQSLMSGAGVSYYPNAVYNDDVFSAKPPTVPAPAQVNPIPTLSTVQTTGARECSVRGCANPVQLSSGNKMCEACREKHRVYASTKRARRKAEKGLVSRLSGAAASASGTAEGADATPDSWLNQQTATPAASYASPIPAASSSQSQSPASTLATSSTFNIPQSQAPVPWIHAIDPRLYSQPTTIGSSQGASSSSTLAGALTLPPSKTSSNATSDRDGSQTTSSCSVSTSREDPARISDVVGGHAQGDTESTSTPTIPAVPTSERPDPGSEAQYPVQTPASNPPPLANGPPRFCSVKGCKATILESMEVYPYKMCQPCRSRYRLYGITKRAKWKAEREAFSRELEGLRVKEDMRRAAIGLPPLADSSEELRAWEISIIDEQVPLPPGYQPITSPSGTVDPSTSGSVSMPMGPLDTRYSRQAFPPDAPVPTRMCTVSHCHQILPGFYRYKRCEAHRIQNRWHSKLKRGREKVEKGFMLPDGTPIITPGPVRPKKIAEPKEKKPRKKREEKGKGKEVETAEGDSTSAPGNENAEEDGAPTNEANTDQSPENESRLGKSSRRSNPYVCRDDQCCNLILPGTRWRVCESCRMRNRISKREEKNIQRVRSDGLDFVNITMDGPSTTEPPLTFATVQQPSAEKPPEIASSTEANETPAAESTPGVGSGSSIAIIPIDVPAMSATLPSGSSSTSTPLTQDKPPADEYVPRKTINDANLDPTGTVRLVRRYKKMAPPKSARFINDEEPGQEANVNVESSKTKSKSTSRTIATTPAATLQQQQNPGPQASPYPYPVPPGTIPYYMPPGYFGLPPQSQPGTATSSKAPPMMYLPSPYPYPIIPPLDRAGTPSLAPGQPTLPYPYYPYGLPPQNYGLPQQYPRPPYPYSPPPPQSTTVAPYAMYRYHSTPQPPPPPPLASTPPPPAAADPNQGFSYYQFKHGMNNPPQEIFPRKRKRDGAPDEVEYHHWQCPPEMAQSSHSNVAPVIVPTATSSPDAPMPLTEVPQQPTSSSTVTAREGDQLASTTVKASQRSCASKTCHRPVSSGANGPLCDKCHAKTKKRKSMTKQRFRLEPKANILAMSTNQAVGDGTER